MAVHRPEFDLGCFARLDNFFTGIRKANGFAWHDFQTVKLIDILHPKGRQALGGSKRRKIVIVVRHVNPLFLFMVS